MLKKINLKRNLVKNVWFWKNKKKIKINIEYSNILLILVSLSIFIFIDSIFLFFSISNSSNEKFQSLVYSHTFASINQAKFIFSITVFGQYALDWAIVVTFMIYTLLGKNKIELGNFYVYFWMFLFLLIGLLPFLSPEMNTMALIKLGIILIPILIVYWGLIRHANDLKWMRRKIDREQRGKRYV